MRARAVATAEQEALAIRRFGFGRAGVELRKRGLLPRIRGGAGGFDADLGSTFHGGTTTTVTFNTTAAASANTRIVILGSYWQSSALITGITVGGTAATKDLNVINSNGQDAYDIWSVPKAAGMTSGSAIVVTFASNTNGGMLFTAVSISGVDLTNGGGVAGHSTGGTLAAGANGTGASWTTTAASSAGAIAVGGVGFENTLTNVPDSLTSGTLIPSSDQYDSTDQQGAVAGYTIGGTTITGSASNSGNPTAVTGGIVAYALAAGGGAGPTFLPRGMPTGV